MVEPHSSNFRVTTTNFLGVRIFRKFTVLQIFLVSEFLGFLWYFFSPLQTQQWGSVEWYHDIDLHEMCCRLAAAALFVQWTSETQTIKQKATLAKPV